MSDRFSNFKSLNVIAGRMEGAYGWLDALTHHMSIDKKEDLFYYEQGGSSS